MALPEAHEKNKKEKAPFHHGVVAAVLFLTRIPLPLRPHPTAFHDAPAHFPLIGALLGALFSLVFFLLLPTGALAAGFLTIGVAMLITGGFHEDGLADTFDGMGGGYTGEDVLRILKDSRIGSFGAAALVISIGARAALLGELHTDALWALPLIGSAARVSPVWIMALLPYAADPDKRKSRDLQKSGIRHASMATGWFGLVALFIFAFASFSLFSIFALVLLLGFVSLILAFWFRQRAGGWTGDFLGATEQVCELVGFALLVGPN